ncbi:MAG: hypothetical protein ACOCWC_04880 [Bacteroidota bacterium]
MKYTKKDFEMVADAIKTARNLDVESPEEVINWFAGYFADKFRKSNPSFDTEKFINACQRTKQK